MLPSEKYVVKSLKVGRVIPCDDIGEDAIAILER